MFTQSVSAAMNTGNAVASDSIFMSNISFWDFILTAIAIFVLCSSVLSVVFILWGGLLLILSGGKDDKIQPAINTIRYAIIGIVITVLSIFLFPIFGRLLGIDVEQYAKPERIFQKIEEIGAKVFGTSNSAYITPNATIEWNIDDIPTDFDTDL